MKLLLTLCLVTSLFSSALANTCKIQYGESMCLTPENPDYDAIACEDTKCFNLVVDWDRQQHDDGSYLRGERVALKDIDDDWTIRGWYFDGVSLSRLSALQADS
ncbi:uncharacterized protein RCO7_01573 [Rhynchosporium graminicola]|uniref:Uncharacterized protein n=1 Tax=Rhynchosporium graminicola TaxID=2792576 RepID=A0A1E1K003_9HELO|nr:uncharacterized protein RCO7_01573 [Rhynchosporium commune]